jgi:hypothetical protein
VNAFFPLHNQQGGWQPKGAGNKALDNATFFLEMGFTSMGNGRQQGCLFLTLWEKQDIKVYRSLGFSAHVIGSLSLAP